MTAPTIPTSSEELTGVLMDRKKMDAIYNDSDPAKFAEFMTNYAAAANKAGKVLEQVDERIQNALTSFATDNAAIFRKGTPTDGRPVTAADIRNQRQAGTFYNRQAQGKPLDGKFENISEFLRVIDHRRDHRDPEIRDQISELKKIKNAMSSTDPSLGGFLIPEEFRATLMEVALEASVVRPRASVIPMNTLRASMPMLDVTSNQTSVYGGIVGYWTEEGASLTQSQPRFGQVSLEAKKLTAYTEIPNELIDDSAISVDGFVTSRFPKAVANFEDRAFMAGTGVGEPLGALNPLNSAMVTQAAEAGQGTATILWENIIKMYSRMLPDSLARAVWLVPPAAFPELATMALNVGTGGSAIWLNNGVQGPPMTILGRPVIVTEKVPNLGTLGDIAFVDFDYYLIGDRMAMSAMASPHYRFANDITAYRIIVRVDGRPWLQSAITPQNGGPALSPFVQLSARP
jgi:HK97 family phage major capsid protein